MKKKSICLLVMILVMTAIAGCGEKSVETETVITTEESAETTEETDIEEPFTESKDSQAREGTLYESPYGYTVTYDNTYFEVVNDEGSDCKRTES